MVEDKEIKTTISPFAVREGEIKTFDGQSCIIPNNIMDTSVIMNTNFTENVGNFLEVEIRYDQDIDKAISIMENLVYEHDLTLNNKDNTKVSISRFTQNGVVLKTTVWTKTLDANFKSCSELRLSLLKAFKEYGIVIPYNTVTIENRLG